MTVLLPVKGVSISTVGSIKASNGLTRGLKSSGTHAGSVAIPVGSSAYPGPPGVYPRGGPYVLYATGGPWPYEHDPDFSPRGPASCTGVDGVALDDGYAWAGIDAIAVFPVHEEIDYLGTVVE